MARFNLESPNQLSQRCVLEDLTAWALAEASSVTEPAPRECITTVCKSLDAFVRWPAKAVLLWNGCDRIAPKGERQRIHSFPDTIKQAAKALKAPLDTRSNGPAIVAFLVSGGVRPKRFGSQNSWSVHHIYSGKFPYIGKSLTLHAAKSGQLHPKCRGCGRASDSRWDVRRVSFFRVASPCRSLSQIWIRPGWSFFRFVSGSIRFCFGTTD